MGITGLPNSCMIPVLEWEHGMGEGSAFGKFIKQLYSLNVGRK